MTKETNSTTTTKTTRPYRKSGKYSTKRESNNKSTPVNVQNITSAIRALETLTGAEQRLVLSSYRSVFSKLN